MDSTNVSIPPVAPEAGPATHVVPAAPREPVPMQDRMPSMHAPQAPGGERCAGCGAQVAADQRYCLECGQRRGEPRLPFMDASSFMETAAQRRRPPAPPPPPRRKRQRISPNAALIAGVGTLLLALGIGVLIGRSGNQGATPTAAAPQVIRVGGGGGEVEAGGASTGGGKTASAKGKTGGGSAKAAKAKAKTGSSGQSAAAEDVLKPSGDVKLPPPETTVGGKCPEGSAGCENGEFNGSFFGE